MKKTFWRVGGGLLSLVMAGCATSKVWEDGQFARYHEPAMPPHLELYRVGTTGDVLVQYDEWRDGSERVRRRAYWLEPNAERLKEKRRPRFVARRAAQVLNPVPTIPESNLYDVPAYGLCAIVSTNGQSFRLVESGHTLGEYDLPVYRDASGRIKQVLLTPPALVADVTVVGGVLVYGSLPGLWPALNCFVH